MSTLEEVRTAEKRLKELVERLKGADAADADNLIAQLKQATDDSPFTRSSNEKGKKCVASLLNTQSPISTHAAAFWMAK
jgi:hypothetical protein